MWNSSSAMTVSANRGGESDVTRQSSQLSVRVRRKGVNAASTVRARHTRQAGVFTGGAYVALFLGVRPVYRAVLGRCPRSCENRLAQPVASHHKLDPLDVGPLGPATQLTGFLGCVAAPAG